MAQITISPTKNGYNHYHQVSPQITNHQAKSFKSPPIFSSQTEVSIEKWQFLAPFLLLLQIWNNHQITDKNSSITITTTSQNYQITTFSATNHQIIKQKVGKSPSPQLLQITKSPIFANQFLFNTPFLRSHFDPHCILVTQ